MYPSQTAPARVADGIVHAVSLVGFLIVGIVLINLAASRPEPWVLIATLAYSVGALFSIGVSFAYHLLPRHEWRPALRKWDHAAIYFVIAGTFSPLLVLCDTWSSWALLAVIWTLAVIGAAFKLAGQIDTRWSLLSYLGLGWMALLALPDFWTELPSFTTWSIVAGGVLYSVGTIFYRMEKLRFRYPIWHTWGTMGGASFCSGIWVALVA